MAKIIMEDEFLYLHQNSSSLSLFSKKKIWKIGDIKFGIKTEF
jgi:hypothetical protein